MRLYKLLSVLSGSLALAGIVGLFAGSASPAVETEITTRLAMADQVHVDHEGDPLPAGARMRLGTLRYRSEERFGGHNIGILADSKTIAIGLPQSRAVQLMDAATGKVIREISTGQIAIRTISMLPNGKQIAVTGQLPEKEDGTVPVVLGILDAASGKMLETYDKDAKDIGFDGDPFQFTPDGKIVVSVNPAGLLRIQELATGKDLLTHQFQRDNSAVFALSADGQTVAVGTDANTQRLFIWKWRDGGDPRELKVPSRGGRRLAFAPDGKNLAECGDLDEIIRVWDVTTGQLLHKLVPPEEDLYRANSLAFTPDGKTLIAAFQGDAVSSIHCWEAATGKHTRRLNGPVGSVLASPDSKLLIATGGGGCRVWEMTTGKELSAGALGHWSHVDHVAVKGNLVISADDHSFIVWDGLTGKQQYARTHDGHGVHTIALSPDGTKLVSAGDRDRLLLWDVLTGKLIYKLAGHGRLGGREILGFTADGRHFLSYGRDNYLREWEVKSGKAVAEHKIQPKGVKIPEGDGEGDMRTEMMYLFNLGQGRFSPDGNLFVLDTRSAFHIFDVVSGKEIYQLAAEGSGIISHTLSPDGRLLLASARGPQIITKLPNGGMRSSATADQPVCLWELATKQIRMKIVLPHGGAGPVVFSSSGKAFAAAINGQERRVQVWDMAGGKEIAVIEGFHGTVYSLAFMDDDKKLVTGMSDTTVLVWDLAAFKK